MRRQTFLVQRNNIVLTAKKLEKALDVTFELGQIMGGVLYSALAKYHPPNKESKNEVLKYYII